MKRLLSLNRHLRRVLKGCCVVLLLLLTTLVVWQVVSRYVFEAPAAWPEELARFAMIWLVFIGAPYVQLCVGGHISVSLIRDSFTSATVRKSFDIGAELLTLLTAAALVSPSLAMLQTTVGVSTPGTGLPRGVMFAAPAIGLSLLILTCALNIVRIARDRGARGHAMPYTAGVGI